MTRKGGRRHDELRQDETRQDELRRDELRRDDRQQFLTALVGISLTIILLARLACIFLQFQTCLYLNDVCRRRVKSQISVPVQPGLEWPEWLECKHTDRAADLYLKSYLIGFAPHGSDQSRSAKNYERKADTLIEGNQFAQAMESLNSRALFFEYVLNLPFLAEACQRCDVSQCRRHTDQARQIYSSCSPATKAGYAGQLSLDYLLLADQAEELAKLFAQHQKLEIAERAYQDAIASGSAAALLEDGANGGLGKAQRYYLSYAAFLFFCHRDDDALSVLDTMNNKKEEHH